MAETLIGTASGMKILSQIGELRQARHTIDRHLNLAQEKRELEVAFKEYFARQGVQDVSPEMIQQAIESYKQNRFTLPAWSGSSAGKALAKAYVWFQPLTLRVSIIAASTALAATLAVSGYDHLQQGRHARVLENARIELLQDVNDFNQSLDKLAGQVTANSKWLAAQAAVKTRTVSSPAVSGLLEDIARSNEELKQTSDDLIGWGKSNVVVDQKGLEQDPLGTLQHFREQAIPHIESVSARLDTVRSIIADKRQRVEQLTAIDTELQSKKAALAANLSSEVSLKIVNVERLLAEGNDLEAKKALADLNAAMVRSVAVGVLTRSVAQMEANYQGLFQDAEGRARFAQLLSQAKTQASQGDQQAFARTASAIDALARYVGTALHFQFVNRNGVQTGFARTNDSTGNKRWYLVVEAVDAAGSPYKMDIYNAETRQTDTVTFWGQEVPKQVFDAVRDDKKSDGILDDTDLGNKPAGHWTVDYHKSVLKTQVTRWSN